MPSLPFKVALFDVDGTLIDSNGAHARAWTEALAAHGIRVPEEEIRRLIGTGGDKLLETVAKIDDHSPLGRAVVAKKTALFSALLPALQATAGARDLLEYLDRQGVRLTVATSASDREVGAILRQAGVDDLFHSRASKDDASRSKPDPDILQAALQKSGVSNREAVMIGDTPYDVEAGQRAGVPVIALRCGGGWSDRDFAGAAMVLDDPAALLARLLAGSILEPAPGQA